MERRNPERQKRVRHGRRLTDLVDPNCPDFVPVSEVARYLNVDRRTVYKWAEAGLLTVHKFPGCHRVHIGSIRSFLAKYRSGSPPAA
jgi:excisionase family DNA binding protein